MATEDEIKEAFFDGKMYAKTGQTHFQDRKSYVAGTAEWRAFCDGFNLEKGWMDTL